MTGLPVSYQVAWGIHERTGRGPKRGLSLDRIVEAGVAVAAAEGLEAVSMSRVAATLRASTMSLYRYVGTKDELLMLMMDAAFDRAPTARRAGEALASGTDALGARAPRRSSAASVDRPHSCLGTADHASPGCLVRAGATVSHWHGSVRTRETLHAPAREWIREERSAARVGSFASGRRPRSDDGGGDRIVRPDAGVAHRWPAVPRPERNDRLWRVRSDRRCGRGLRLRARADPRWDRGARAGATARMIENATNFQFPTANYQITNYQLPHSP